MKRKMKLCLALFLALVVMAQYSFSSQALVAYGLDNTDSVTQTEETTEATEATEATEPAESTDATEATEATKPADEEEPSADVAYPAVEFSEKAGDVKVNISAPEGALPEGTTVEVTEVESSEVQDAVEELIGEAKVVKAVDITFLNKEGKAIEPEKKVSVTFASKEFKKLNDAQVIHITDEGNAEAVEGSTVAGNKASFKSDDFSIYVVTDGDTIVTEQRTYKFVEPVVDGNADAYFFMNKAGETVDNQIIKNGDELEEVNYPYQSSMTLEGWYILSGSPGNFEYTNKKISFETAITDVTTTETVYVAPFFRDVYYVTFHQTPQGTSADDDIIQTKKIVYTSGTNANKVLISDVIAPQPDERHVFYGWTDGTTEYSIYDENNSQVVETYITNITSDTDIYPVFKEAYWLRFVSGPRATYIPAQFVLKNQAVTTLSVPTRTGYDFAGWYKGSMDDEGTITYGDQVSNETGQVINPESGLTLDSETTLYAKWTAKSDATYTVIIWKQKVSDNKNATDAQKTYDYETSETRTGVTDQEVGPSATDISHEYTGFHYSRTVQNSETIKADGTTVINVYYDRDLVAINFYYQSSSQTAYVYTETTDNDGTQYGLLSDGSYVELTRGNGETVTRTYYTYGNWPPTEYTDTFYTRSGWWPYTYTATEYNGNNLPPANSTVTYYGLTGTNWLGNPDYSELTRRTSTTTTYDWTYTKNGTTYHYKGVRFTRAQLNNYKLVTITGLYGQSFTQAGVSWPNTHEWNEKRDGSGFGMTLLTGFTMDEPAYNLYDQGTAGTYSIYHYKQTINGNYSETGDNRAEAKTSSYNLKWTFDNKFDGFTVKSYSTNDEGFKSNGGSHGVTPGQTVEGLHPTLHIYHERNKYTITYKSVDENGDLQTVKDNVKVYYEAPMADYDYSLSQVGLEERDHYDFTGWYVDEDCTVPYDFENGKMPAANVVVYAGWEKKWYQIIVDPDGGVITPSIGATYFWKQYGDTFSSYTIERKYIKDNANGTYQYVYVDGKNDPDGNTPAAQRTATYVEAGAGYEGDKYRLMTEADPEWHFVGWYVVNDQGVTTSKPYDFSSIVEGPVTIRAVWNLEGRYNVAYNPTSKVDGVNVSGDFNAYDNSNYAHGAEIVLPVAPSNVNSKYLFEGWEVVDENGEVLDDNGGKYYQPGDELTLDAASWADRQKVIHIQAHYSKVQESDIPVSVTFIKYDGINPGDTTLRTGGKITVDRDDEQEMTSWVRVDDIQINKEITLYGNDEFFRVNHILAGWNTNAKEAGYGEVEYECGQKVAADNLKPKENTLYAVWKALTLEGISDSKVYDGQALKGGVSECSKELEGATFTYSVLLDEETDKWSAFTANVPSITGVGTLKYKVKAEKGLLSVISQTATLQVTHKTVTIKPDANQWKYYGEEDPELTATVEGLIGNDSITYELSRDDGEDVGHYGINATFKKTQGNYYVNNVVGDFEIKPAELNLTVSDYNKPYDGQAHSVVLNNLPEGTKVEYSEDGENWSSDAPKWTDVEMKDGEYVSHKVYVRASNPNYTDAKGEATVTITKASATVNVTFNRVTVTHDSQEHQWILGINGTESYTCTNTLLTSLCAVQDISCEEKLQTAPQTEVGTYYAKAPTDQDKYSFGEKDQIIQNNFDITINIVQEGCLEITSEDAPDPTPDPTPTPTPTPNPGGGGGGPAGGGGAGAVAAAPAAPAPAATNTVVDNPTPTTINEPAAPKAAPSNWALINLLSMLATALLSLIMLIRYFGKRKEEDELGGETEEKRGGMARIASLVPAIGAIVAFIVTEDLSGNIALVDKWTVLMIVILAIQAGVGVVAKMRDNYELEDVE